MEIERKCLVKGWPEGLCPEHIYTMEQGYLALHPTTVRIRRETERGGITAYILCFKGKGGLVREEIEVSIDETLFERLRVLIGLPLIRKERRDYLLPDGRTLEVNEVDAGAPGTFFYAEVEFPTVEASEVWSPGAAGLASYLADEVTEKQGVSMGAYWERTRYDVQ